MSIRPRTETAAARKCPDCDTVHDYNCRKYGALSIAAALWVTLLLLILVAALPEVIR